jgi:hypothetical protein
VCTPIFARLRLGELPNLGTQLVLRQFGHSFVQVMPRRVSKGETSPGEDAVY